jgi:hypothetical protein
MEILFCITNVSQPSFIETNMSMTLSETIASLHETQSVYLRNANLDAEGAVALADALAENTSMTKLNLIGNKFGANGASALADALKVNTALTTIDLECNGIGDDGASALADALKVNASVTEIDLSCNGIDDEGASALADAVQVNTTVTCIDLNFSIIGDEGVLALANALKVNTSVTNIGLFLHPDEHTARNQRLLYRHIMCTSVIALLDRNKRLRSLFLFDARWMLLSSMGGCADDAVLCGPTCSKAATRMALSLPTMSNRFVLSLLLSLRSVVVVRCEAASHLSVSCYLSLSMHRVCFFIAGSHHVITITLTSSRYDVKTITLRTRLSALLLFSRPFLFAYDFSIELTLNRLAFTYTT